MPIITISRGSLSGGRALAERVAAWLGYRCITSEELIEAAAHYGVPEPKLSQVLVKGPSFWERLMKARHLYLIFLQAAMYELAREGDLVYHGQAGQQLLRGIAHGITVRLIAPLEDRLRAVMARKGLPRARALQYVRQVDEARVRQMRDLFHVDWRDAALYDVVVNLEHMRLERAADAVIYLARHPAYQATPASEKQLADLAMTWRVKASLAVHGGDVEVRAEDGIVWLTGFVISSEATDFLVRMTQMVSGVTEVISELEIKPVFPYTGV
jgi:cytidylate kinase